MKHNDTIRNENRAITHASAVSYFTVLTTKKIFPPDTTEKKLQKLGSLFRELMQGRKHRCVCTAVGN
jgi:hypothetical protein